MGRVAKLYISGPMTGLPEFNYPAFATAAAQLREAGYEVFSPHEVPAQESWRDYMRVGIAGLLDCDGVATLDGHENSKGATLECHIARQLELLTLPVGDWLLTQSMVPDRKTTGAI